VAERIFDVMLIGGGPGGYVAAIRAAQLGLATALVERAEIGGVCLNWGCIPTKALLHTADVLRDIESAAALGIDAGPARVDLARVVARSRAVAQQLNRGVTGLLKKNKVQVYDGVARITEPGRIAVDDAQAATLGADAIVIATGARAKSLPGIEPDGRCVWSAREAMVPDALPKRLLVIGAGAIGIEFASFYRTLGSEVTVVEVLPRILPVEDQEISAFAHKAFEKQGIRILVGATVKGAKKGKDNVAVTVEVGGKSQDITVERVISAVGIVGNVEGIGLEGTGVKVDRTHVVIDEYCRTGEPGVYAIGDLAGPPWLAHKAMHEGVVCVEKIAGLNDVHPMDVSNIPGCTYCRPQVASVGLTEAAAREAGHEVKVGRFPFIGNGKAIAMGEPEGMVKTVFDAKTGELLGAHMIGAEVTEMIQGYTIARTLESTEAELMATVFPHPTVSETMHEAVLDAYGRAIHF